MTNAELMRLDYKYTAILLCAVLMTVQGCYKDKGNYDYHDVNSLTVTLDCPTPYNLTMG